MKALVLSGGGAKGAFTAGVVRYMLRDKGMDFNLAVGTSTGSLIGGPALLSDYNYLANIYIGVENKDIFKNSIFGGILNFLKLVDGPIQADMGPLRERVVKYYLNDGKLQKLIDLGKEFIVTAVNVRTGKLHFISTKEVSEAKIKHATFVNAIIASCSEPVFTKPIQIYEHEPDSAYQSDLFYDGGVKEFLPLEHASVLGASEIWAISTNPLTNTETEWGGKSSPNRVNLLKALIWTVVSFLDEIARGDRFRADLYFRWDKVKKIITDRARELGLSDAQAYKLVDFSPEVSPTLGLSLPEFHLIFPEKVFGEALDFDPAVMASYLDQGILTAEKYFKKGAPIYNASLDDPTLRPWIKSEWIGGTYT